ncbi:MAG: DUF1592 domain-containing protein [Planctomycetes bacterium]|nr:DUF1592 domain-containing protein [Planctomycetota bacterium]
MPNPLPRRLLAGLALSLASAAPTAAQEPTLAEVRAAGRARSSYLTGERAPAPDAAPVADLPTFRARIEPILAGACYRCHGPRRQKGDLRLDTLDPDLFTGDDVDWWLDVLAAVSNGEMPPADADPLADADRARLVDWLATESQRASRARRATSKHTSFRRLTRYEFHYALQDLLGAVHDVADDLPPDATSADGFANSSDVLHVSDLRFRAYLDAARKALRLLTVTGERPTPLRWSVPMAAAAAVEFDRQQAQRDQLAKKFADRPEQLGAELKKLEQRQRAGRNDVHYVERSSGRTARQQWNYNGGRYAWAPSSEPVATPPIGDVVAHVPPRRGLKVELGDRVPERGTLRVRIRAARATAAGERPPRVRLVFGWQASNDSRAHVVVSGRDVVVDAPPDAPRFYQWDVPIERIYPRNSVRGVNRMGDLPNPSEYLRIDNASRRGDALLVDYVEVTAPVFEQWPPATHRALFPARRDGADDRAYAREALARLLPRAWRRPPTADELARKVALFERLRPSCDDAEQALVEVYAAVLASPNFLFVAAADADAPLADHELATRLSLLLWCSVPDDELLELAAAGRLREPDVFDAQLERLLRSPRSARFAQRFVRQWLGLEPLDYLAIDRKAHPGFDDALLDAMRREPIAFFEEVLRQDLSVLEFVHSDFAMANERLARHYGRDDVVGDEFRRIALAPGQRRGGLLTQAGLLAMNSDGKDSHPLKRGIWMLERLLDDPPPPPAAVPEIDLADPRVAQMTLKQRIEDHRNHAACLSCHRKIDPWGIAFENYDAVGRWRTDVAGEPVDAVGVLFNDQRLDGMDGLKRFLLTHRQDQLVRALVRKLTTFALGRPLTFGDRAAIDEITAEVRARGDGLATMVRTIARSPLFRSR